MKISEHIATIFKSKRLDVEINRNIKEVNPNRIANKKIAEHVDIKTSWEHRKNILTPYEVDVII